VTGGRFSICVLGSSHVAAVVAAWRRRTFRLQKQVSLTFFAAPNLSLDELELEGRSLVPRSDDLRGKIAYTSGGKERVDIDDYDAFVTLGLGFSIAPRDLTGEYGTVEHLASGPVQRLVSRVCYEEMLMATFGNRLYLNLAGTIRSVTSAPILAVPKPFKSETALDEPPLREKTHLRDPAFLERQFAICARMTEQLCATRGAQVLWPPAETMALPGFTKREFTMGALRLTRLKHDPSHADGKHMNEDYGCLVLNAIFAKLDEMSDGQVIKRRRRERPEAAATPDAATAQPDPSVLPSPRVRPCEAPTPPPASMACAASGRR
jgi:hypothetical protein